MLGEGKEVAVPGPWIGNLRALTEIGIGIGCQTESVRLS